MQAHTHTSWRQGTTRRVEYRQRGLFGAILDATKGMPTFKALISILSNCSLERLYESLQLEIWITTDSARSREVSFK